MLTGLLTIRAFSIEHRFVNELCETLDRNSTSFLLVQSSARWLGLILDLVSMLKTFFFVVT
jgi:ATP-binding cassette, subfamily C (CFTR/MRP), member 1